MTWEPRCLQAAMTVNREDYRGEEGWMGLIENSGLKWNVLASGGPWARKQVRDGYLRSNIATSAIFTEGAWGRVC